MSLHRSIPDYELPKALLKLLVFGDRSQIEAMNVLDARITKMETEEAKIAEGRLKRFNITITYSGEQEISVLAVNKTDAERKARAETDSDFADIEIDWVTAREVKA